MLYSLSICLVLDLALLFWNHMATWRGCSPSSPASCCLVRDSGLESDRNMTSSDWIWSSLNLFLFFPPHVIVFMTRFWSALEVSMLTDVADACKELLSLSLSLSVFVCVVPWDSPLCDSKVGFYLPFTECELNNELLDFEY